MYKKSHLLACLALATALAGAVQAAPLAPDDASINDNLCLWLRNPGINLDEASGMWTDSSGRGNDAVPAGDISGATYVGPTLSFGSNPTVFNGEFSTAKFSGDVDDLLRAANINGGTNLSELTIIAVYKLYNQDQSGAGMTRPVGVGSFIGEGANLGNYFNLANDVSIRKDNGSVQGATATHPDDEFFVRAARMNASSINQWFNTTGTLELVHEASGASYTTSTDNFYLGDLRADSTDGGGTSGYSTSDIEIAEVIVYNTDLTDAQIEGINEWLQGNVGSGGGNPLATAPNPADGILYENTWVSLSWRAGYYAVSHDLYFGTDFVDVNDGAEGTFFGNMSATSQVVGFPGFPAPDGLRPGTTYFWRIDEVNDANAASPWKGDIWSFSIPPKTAYDPDPADGAEFVDPNATFSWTGGFAAKLHTVYMGTNFDDVNDAAGGTPSGSASYSPGTLESEKVYYWRVDEFDPPTTYKGDVWSFTTPGSVGNPQPANGAVDVQITANLSWTPADNAASHELYFGADADAVAVKNATTASPEYIGPRTLGAESYDPGGLAWDSSYAWRVDEVYPTETVKGLVWTFETADFILVDDFESYDDIDPLPGESGINRIFDKWIDGFGTTTNGALVGNDLPPYAETTIVHSGVQSLVYRYDNANKTSEATLTLVYPKDWTAEGVTKLSLWFRGASGNAAERMFVALGGNAVVYHDDAAATRISRWTEWIVDLTRFADQGVNLANVNTITIGFGTKNSPAAGSTGQMYFDDIRLYR